MKIIRVAISPRGKQSFRIIAGEKEDHAFDSRSLACSLAAIVAFIRIRSMDFSGSSPSNGIDVPIAHDGAVPHGW